MNARRENELDHDLESLRGVTERDLPTVHATAQNLAAQAGRALLPTAEGFWTRSCRFLSARRGLAMAGAGVVVAAVLGIVPVTYERTLGHDVTLTIAAPAPGVETLGRIAAEFQHALAPAETRRTPGIEDGDVVVAAWVPSRSGRSVERTVTAFANALRAQGVPAHAQVTPRFQRMSTNVYAMAMNRVIDLHIDHAGRSPAEIEADVRAQLEAAGVQNPRVQVSQSGDQTKIQIQTDSDGAEGDRQFNIQLKAADGQPLDPRLHQFQVERKPGMTDADVKSDIERQMREAGVEGQVTVENGRVEVKVQHEQER